MKILTMYLPQFHHVKENDEWWGDGFTDWVSTKNAKKLYDGHYQPHIPLESNYYDLSDIQVMRWQAELMNQYGIDGQCIYHYWFKDGRQILEKPAENLLLQKDINMPFCFCWANETWARSWSNIRNKNTWTDKNTVTIKENDNGILLEQKYGDHSDWKKHFDYLSKFFLDKRYIKQDNKPLFLIYKSSDIMCLEDMIQYFNQQAIKIGFDGVYFICANASKKLPYNANAILQHEPLHGIQKLDYCKYNDGTRIVEYEEVWKYIVNGISPYRKKTYYEGVVGYDDTPRRGGKGTVINNASPQIFGKYLTKLLARSDREGNEFVFLNAWNEWGEGMHLEPDERWKHSFLEEVKKSKEEYKKTKFSFDNSIISSEICELNDQKEKYENYLNYFDRWMTLKERGVLIADYLKEKKNSVVMIYGYGIFARHLLQELKENNISVYAVVDKQKNRIEDDVNVIFPEEIPDKNGLIIVTAFHYYAEIKNSLINKSANIISITDILDELENRISRLPCNPY